MSAERPETITFAKRVFDREGADAPALLAECTRRLSPIARSRAASEWLVERLRTLWQSTTPAGSLAADAWLDETGRFLQDLPGDIVSDAIDETIRRGRGFTPTAGEILAHANPMLLKRQYQRAALDMMVNGIPKPPRKPWEPETRELSPEDRVSPEEMDEILRRHGIDLSDRPEEPNRFVGPKLEAREARAPSVEDYVRMGVDRETAERCVAERTAGGGEAQ
ncbi:hypothetical protein [Sphingomonas sp.]|uniref:hypothetical protein n=1 Tax=Sphingomonas sp. TaxID=28214 RepID=UPI00307F529F